MLIVDESGYIIAIIFVICFLLIPFCELIVKLFNINKNIELASYDTYTSYRFILKFICAILFMMFLLLFLLVLMKVYVLLGGRLM